MVTYLGRITSVRMILNERLMRLNSSASNKPSTQEPNTSPSVYRNVTESEEVRRFKPVPVEENSQI